MVENEGGESGRNGATVPGGVAHHARLSLHLRPVLVIACVVGVAGCTVAFALGGGAAAGQPVRVAAHRSAPTASPAVVALRAAAPPVAAAAASTVPATTTTEAAPVPAAPATTTPATTSVGALVAQVESAGIDPGTAWSWSMGSTTVGCGAIRGSGSATGCTSWSSGVVRTVFTGSPTLGLVAHEVANAEVAEDAVPALLAQVAADAGSSSWSPTDAVASCLVLHALGFQDGAAGSWQCPAALGSYVAAHIHDTVATTTTTATCGVVSGRSSTLNFNAGAGTLTVTGPAGAPAQVAGPGETLTVSGVGAFTAVDVGATPTISGVCEG